MMPEIIILCPSRGKPELAADLVRSFMQTGPTRSKLVLIISPDEFWSYLERIDDFHLGESDCPIILHRREEGNRRGAVFPLNTYLAENPTNAPTIGLLGDDTLFRSEDWESQVLAARATAPLVYANDGLNGRQLCTMPFLDARIPKALGFIMPPMLAHLYGDDFLMRLGRNIGMRYLPDVLIEHIHPFAGKRPMDDATAALNAQTARQADFEAWAKYQIESFATDLAKVKAALIDRGDQVIGTRAIYNVRVTDLP